MHRYRVWWGDTGVEYLVPNVTELEAEIEKIEALLKQLQVADLSTGTRLELAYRHLEGLIGFLTPEKHYWTRETWAEEKQRRAEARQKAKQERKSNE